MSRNLLKDPQFCILQQSVDRDAQQVKLKEGKRLVAYWETVEAQPKKVQEGTREQCMKMLVEGAD